MLTESWLANHELPEAVHAITGEWYSEGGLSARVRDLRKLKYGGLTVETRRPKGKSYFEYHVKEAA